VFELPEDGTGVSKHVAIVRDGKDLYAVCAFGWFCKSIFRGGGGCNEL